MTLKIISMVKINGQWVNQDEVPTEEFQEVLTKAMIRAANAIGAKVQKTAGQAEKRGQTLKKDVINSLIIGLPVTYLPLLNISGAAEHLTGILAIGVVAFG